MEDNNQKPIVLLLLQGWGLNLSWQKNAIISAKADNFNNLWKKYSHLVLESSNKSESLNKRCFYEEFYKDTDPKTNSKIIDESFTGKSIHENKTLQGLYAHVLKHNSKLHIIGTISEDNRFGDLDHLINLVKLSKSNGVYQQYIHLFVDNFSSKNKVIEILNGLQAKLLKIGNAQIATISTLNNLYLNDNLAETLNTIISGRGKRVLSFEQMFSAGKKGAEWLGSFIISNSRTMISDFDAVIFFDHNCEAVLPLSKYFFGLFNYPEIRRLKFLKILYLIDAPWDQADKNICSSTSSSWFSRLSKSHGILLANKADCDLISSITNIPQNIRKIELEDVDRSEAQEKIFIAGVFEFIKDRIKKKKDDLIIVDLPFIANVCQGKNFGRVETTVKNLDSLLSGLESCILENGGILLVSSFYGMAEEIVEVSLPFGERTQFSSNPLPLIEVSNYSKKLAQQSLGILDLMNIKYNQSYLKKIIINHLDR